MLESVTYLEYFYAKMLQLRVDKLFLSFIIDIWCDNKSTLYRMQSKGSGNQI